MRVYSPFFSTLYDEAGPVGSLGRGTHYSILRAVIWPNGEPRFHDFAVIWDEDHDLRIIWVIEQLYARRLLQPIIAIGERKGGVTALTSTSQPQSYESGVYEVTSDVPSDSFGAEIQLFPGIDGMVINDTTARVRDYLAGIHALWVLGTKACQFTTEPFHVPARAASVL